MPKVKQKKEKKDKSVKLKSLKKAYKKSRQKTKGSYAVDVMLETQAIAQGGFYTPQTALLTAPILAQAQIRFCNGTGFYNQKVAFKTLNKVQAIIPIQEIHTTLQDTAIAPNPFAMARTYEGGVTHFIYTKAQAAHVLLSGCINVYVRLSGQAQEALRQSGHSLTQAPAIGLYIGTTARPKADSQLHYQLAVDQGWKPRPLFKLDPFVRYRLPLAPYETLEKLLINVPAKLLTIVNGYIAEQSISTSQGRQKKAHKMTSWFDIGAEAHLWLKTNGQSNAFRMQWQDQLGNIVYDTRLEMGLISANRVVAVPHYAVKARVWFNDANNPVHNTSTDIEIKALPEALDPLFGFWSEYQFNINSLHYFEPEHEYHFLLQGFAGQQWQFDSRGFFIISGGIQFFINVRDELQQQYDRLRS